MAVQFSRGCPYDCEFCDVVAMNGRVPRTKTPVQVIAELDAPRRPGRRLSWMDTQALLKSFWHLGVAHRGRLGFWWLVGTTLLRRPRHFRHAIELLIVGYHFRRVGGLL